MEPLKEMEARHGAVQESAQPSAAGVAARLAKGLRTPESAFVKPILRALEDLGGSATTQQVLERVAAAIKDQLKGVDFQSLKSDPGRPRWNNTAQWARNTMVEEGLLKKNSPRGVWEITVAGRDRLRKDSARG